ncbi:MAG: hypothetical protein AAF462_02255 [Thermodesulfobacteriota bacterium]
MSDLIGKIKGKIDKGISTVNVKSKEIIGKQKIRLQISELGAERKNVLLEIGKLAHLMIEASDSSEGILVSKSSSKKSKQTQPDKWELAVLSVLSEICSGSKDKILFEDTDKEFKITAKALSAEVQKSLPKSEQKGQNLQWLGRVLGKFGIASRKYSKRINGERETVYEFDKKTTLSALNKVGGSSTPSKDENSLDYTEQIVAKSKEINELDSKIAKLEEQLTNVAS